MKYTTDKGVGTCSGSRGNSDEGLGLEGGSAATITLDTFCTGLTGAVSVFALL